MRNILLTVVVLAWAAIPSKASVNYSDVSLTLIGPGINQTVDGQTSLDDAGSTDGAWAFTADLITNLTPVGGGNFRSPDMFTATLDDLTLTCEQLSGCAATQISFDVSVTPLNGGSHKVPWEVDLAGTLKSLNATFADNLTANSYKVFGNGTRTVSFNASRSGTSIFIGAVDFNGTIDVSHAVDGATLTLPFGADFGVPEPATLGLMGMALAGLGLLKLRRRNQR